jgi:hypothetical protein
VSLWPVTQHVIPVPAHNSLKILQKCNVSTQCHHTENQCQFEYILILTHKGPVQNNTALSSKSILKKRFQAYGWYYLVSLTFVTYDHFCHVLLYTTWNMYRNILIYVQQDAMLNSLFYMKTALHVLGGNTTHHQEHQQPYLQHLVFITLLLPSATNVEKLEQV